MTDDKAAKEKADLDYVTGVNNKSEMQAAYESSMEIMNMWLIGVRIHILIDQEVLLRISI